jgi:NAD-dependent dihydropyrimidine dehydrogenase PreA subunit
MKYLKNVTSIKINPDRCTGCGVCLEVCPHDVLRVGNGKASIIDRDSCMECGACVSNCAFAALSVDKGVGCAAALINSMITGGEPTCGCSSSDSGCC